MKIQLRHKFEEIVSVENLLLAWSEFIRGKRNKSDVQQFDLNLIDNILLLHEELASRRYAHGGYYRFNISDPKPRIIHKASVRDRLIHHAVHRLLYPFFERTFTADSFSCRVNKGTHRAMNRFRSFAYRVSKNHTKTCWVLKCDIRKFFHSIDHKVLISILKSYIPDKNILWLLENIISSFSVNSERGLPLGNLTSQLFANLYMNELDQFIKHRLKAKYYIRYADDFVFLSESRQSLVEIICKIREFLNDRLRLGLHRNKIKIKTFGSGVDFLGWVHFSDHRVLKGITKRRMLNRIRNHPTEETLQSYLGLLSHGNTFEVRHLVGKAMAELRGRGNPEILRKLIEKAIV